MSHTATVKSIKIISVNALRAAVGELAQSGVKVELIPDATPRAFYPNQEGLGKADFVLKLADSPYDVGLYKTEDGSYEARTDFWGDHVKKVLGAKASRPETEQQARLGKLFQLYGVHAATESARRQGHMVRRVNGTDGRIRLEVTGPNL